MLPTTTSDGRDVVPMTEEQKYELDVNGWFCVPGVLTEDEITRMRAHMAAMCDEENPLPAAERGPYGGPISELLDHPVVVGVLQETLYGGGLCGEQGYNFRCEGGFCTRRKAGHDNWSPHGGGGFFKFPGNSHTYHAQPGKIHTGLTRAVWELTEVRHGQGGTKLISGSHKAAFPLPQAVREDRNSKMWSTYSCPAGSVLFFTEAITHTGDLWTVEDHDREAIFMCYNDVGAQFHGGGATREQVERMPPKRQSLFRGVWTWTGGTSLNTRYDSVTNYKTPNVLED